MLSAVLLLFLSVRFLQIIRVKLPAHRTHYAQVLLLMLPSMSFHSTHRLYGRNKKVGRDFQAKELSIEIMDECAQGPLK